MKTLLRSLALPLAFGAAALMGAAPAPLDLGQGLTYYRIHALPGDLPVTSGPGGARIIDLRFAKADAAAAGALAAWVRFNAAVRSPLFVLENAQTDPTLRAVFTAGPHPGLLVLAPSADGLRPDIPVSVAADTDRKAYLALESGAPVASLLADNPEKPRTDEAYLEKEHLSDSDVPDAALDRPSPPSPLVDALLQRAVQLHRGLAALKRI